MTKKVIRIFWREKRVFSCEERVIYDIWYDIWYNKDTENLKRESKNSEKPGRWQKRSSEFFGVIRWLFPVKKGSYTTFDMTFDTIKIQRIWKERVKIQKNLVDDKKGHQNFSASKCKFFPRNFFGVPPNSAPGLRPCRNPQNPQANTSAFQLCYLSEIRLAFCEFKH